MYTADDFNTENAPKEMVEYVINNVEDFEPRYQHALKIIGRNKCPLQRADYQLWSEINDEITNWCYENDIEFDDNDYDIEEIFG